MANKIELAIEALNKSQAAFNDVKRQITELENTAKKGSMSIGSAIATLKQNWLGLTATITAVTLAVRQAFEYMEKGAKAEQAEAAFRSIAKTAGESADEIIEAMKRASNETIDDSALMQKAAKGMMQGLSGDQLVNITKAARTAAMITGQDVSQAFDTITDAIANKMPRSLVQYGLVTKEQMRLINEAMAMGITEVNIYAVAMENAKRQQSLLTEDQISHAETLQRWKAIFEDIREKIGKALLWLVDNALTPIADWFKNNPNTVKAWASSVVEILYTVRAEFLRLMMLIDKAGGSLTWLPMLVYGPGSAMGNENSKKQFEKFAQMNIDFEDRYNEHDKELQSLAIDLNNQLDKINTPPTVATEKKTSTRTKSFSGSGSSVLDTIPKIRALREEAAKLESQLAELDGKEKLREISHVDAAEKRLAIEQRIYETYQQQLNAKDDEGGNLIKDPNFRAGLEKSSAEALRKISEYKIALKELTGSFDEGMTEGLAKYLDSIGSTFQQAQRLAQDAAQGLQSAFSDFFFDVFQGKLKSLRDYITSFLNSIGKAVSNYLAELAVAGLIKGVGKLFSGGSGTTATDAAAGSTDILKPHSGGYIMHSGGLVPRFHLGGNLAPDERAAILQTGEYVVSRKGVAALDKINTGQIGGGGVNVVVRVENQSGQQLDAQASETKFDGEKYIVGVILKNANGYGPLYHLLKQGVK